MINKNERCTRNTASASNNELHALALVARAVISAYRTVPVISPFGKFQDLRASIKSDVANTRELATHELSRVALHTARLLQGTARIASRSRVLVSLC